MNKENKIIIAPSLLSADFSNMVEAVNLIEESGGDWIHFDVMDGSFVPNITFGHKMVKDLRKHSKLPFDVHLMVFHPETQISDFIKAGADHITIQAESTIHLHRIINRIKQDGIKAGISIVPSSSISMITELLSIVDQILIMMVNPGFGGQELIDETLMKVSLLDSIRKDNGYNYLIEVDGGVSLETKCRIMKARPDVYVTGSAFFNFPDPKEYIMLLKNVD